MKKYLLIAATLFFASNSFAQDVLPKLPNGPKIKQDAFENYQWQKDSADKDTNAMISFYKAQDYKNALIKAKSLSEKNDKNATALAGYIYEMGLGLEAPDYTQAVFFYRNAIKLGSIDAMIGLGRIASIGQSDIPLLEANDALETAIAAKRSDAVMPMADFLIRSGSDKMRGFALYQGLADAGDIDAAYKAAVLLDDGDIFPPDDPIMAQKYLMKSATGGNHQAEADLGLYFYLGKAGIKNQIEAASWFKKAAEGGDKQGAFYWALVNAKGEGVKADLQTAIKYSQIAKDEVPQAQRLYDQLQKYIVTQK